MATCLCMGGPYCCMRRPMVFPPNYYRCQGPAETFDLTSPAAWRGGPPKTWGMWRAPMSEDQPNRWRMKQQRVRERRALGSAAGREM